MNAEPLNCPNCGAPITGEICEYCGSRVLPRADAETLNDHQSASFLADWTEGVTIDGLLSGKLRELTRIVDREDRRRRAGRLP